MLRSTRTGPALRHLITPWLACMAAVGCGSDSTGPRPVADASEAAAVVAAGSVNLTYMCGNRWRARNTALTEVVVTYDVYQQGESAALRLPARGAYPYSETLFATNKLGTTRLLDPSNNKVLVTKAAGNVACGSYRLGVAMDGDATGTLPSGVSTQAPGTTISYSFAAGANDVLNVLLDGAPVAATGQVTMDRDHSLYVGVDPGLTLSADAAAVYASERALLTAGDPEAAFRTYLSQISEVVTRLGGAEATRQFRAISMQPSNPVADAAGLQRLEAAIAGKVFPISPRAGGASLHLSSSSTVDEPTTILFVNGFSNTLVDHTANVVALLEAVQNGPLAARTRLDVDGVWNVSHGGLAPPVPSFPEPELCIAFAALSDRSLLAAARFALQCLALAGLQNNDVVEGLVQYAARLATRSYLDQDAVGLAAGIDSIRHERRNVIAVLHSQGNLIFSNTINRTGGDELYGRGSCLGAVSLAAPLPVEWPFSQAFLRLVQVQGDIVTSLPGAPAANTTNELSDQVDGIVRAVPLTFTEEIAARTVAGFRLHSFAKSYLRQPRSKAAVLSGLQDIYGNCRAANVSFSGASTSMFVGSSQSLPTVVTNGSGLALNGRYLSWSSSLPSVASIDSTGTVVALAAGTATITATTLGGVEDSIVITVTALTEAFPPGLTKWLETGVSFKLSPASPVQSGCTRFWEIRPGAFVGARVTVSCAPPNSPYVYGSELLGSILEVFEVDNRANVVGRLSASGGTLTGTFTDFGGQTTSVNAVLQP